MKKRDRAGRHVSAGHSSDGSGLTACIATLPSRTQRRNSDRRDTQSESDAIIVTQEHDVKRCVVPTTDHLCHLSRPLFGHGSGKAGEQ
jgi:hypothetical protein